LEEGSVSILAVIVLIAVAVLLLAMLLAGGRQAAEARTRDDSHPDGLEGHRSHAEASRRGDVGV
jgi:hypothetical protein